MIFALLAVGCGRDKAGKPGAPEAPAPAKMVPGGQLIYGSLLEPNTLNPLLSDLVATAEVGSLIFSGLVQVNDKGEWQADLASEVPTLRNGGVSPDGLTVTYRLRPGVTWHDGAPFTSADVKFTWETIMNRRVNVVSRDGYDMISAVDTPDANTVVVRFRQYYAPYLTLFTTILPRHLLANAEDIGKASFNRGPVGTGPFRFKEWRLAEAIVLEANPAYFKGRPNLDSIVYKIIPDSNIMLTQLKAGEVDIVSNVGIANLEQVKAVGGVRAVMTPNMIWEHLDFNLDNALFKDARVRRAVALALDRQAIVNSVVKGAASVAVGDQSPLSWAYNPVLKPPARDVGAARELLEQAGFKPGTDGVYVRDGQRLAFNLVTTTGNKTREAVAREVAQQLKEAGVEATVRLVDAPVFFGDVLRSRRFEAAMFAWVAGLDPDNASLWHSRNIPSAGNRYQGQNYAGWRNPEVDGLIEQGARLVDVEARRQAYLRIQELIAQEAPVIPLYFRSNVDAVRDTVVNYKPNPTQAGNLWNAREWGLTKKR
ncbi:peptide ABC transporter substrate-binding protein [Anaeroselena agilis]|uniref:Peptide ABC transporter substrate-binding protein n=1 Tax=Anaeroselena agilis TaxID=3063788 RepID=A0ABU3NV85_9FIRM|nr:peptide ABC transporter substrate-binding protein [Selenomonadales bacterium 4137-cl]